MGILDEPLRQVAKTVYQTVLSPSTLVRQPRATYDPVKREEYLPQSSSHPVSLLVEDYDRRFVDGKSILAGDLRGSFPAAELAFEPSPELDTITRNGVKYRIVAVGKSELDSAIVYELQLRRG